ncbi:alpha-amylase family glycosyl hydrolase [Salinicoccus hispanicus]|uniref:Glycosyl hydrolase family 13 catalytic domain-containing protein n=1 Tax=Salinicoccus hispanicus TaxID=157225 RepID=A0A6N8U0L6_9STAP|nr:alpha-amylase family glycosyl hydrolase [Salinicoccus hispanicus]MXQ50847.1 hypothetical protein [Salinicoccus hispanicus]
MKKLVIYMAVLLAGVGIFSPEASAQDGEAERIYTIIVDRFLNGDDSNDINVTEDMSEALPFGGDFIGIENNLGYIQEMGFDTLMLSPVFDKADDDYLGYNVENYEEIEAAFGGAEAFQSLIDAAHERGMEVVVDMPVTAVDGYETLDDPVLNDIQQSYYDMVDARFIDLTDADNQVRYQAMARTFVDTYDVDGLSMNIVQDGLDASSFMPDGVKTYGIVEDGGLTAEGFDQTTDPAMRSAIVEAFSTTDTEIPDYPTDDSLLLADHWFTERFTINAVEANMFPGKRISQLTAYLYGYPGSIAFQYGTEVAFSGDEVPGIHPQMDLWTDQEVVDYIVSLNEVLSKHPQLYQAERELIKNEDGHYVQRYHTSDVDFILNINDTSVTKNVGIPMEAEDEGKMLSGLLIGDLLRSGDMEGEEFLAVLDREETELYAIIEERGFNNGYLYAGLLIFGGFGIFIWLVARKRKR